MPTNPAKEISKSNVKVAAPVHYDPKFQREFLKPKYFAIWALIGLVMLLVWLPRRLSLLIGSGIGMVLYIANKKRRDIAAVNLAMSFPEKTDEQRHKLMIDSYKSYGQNIIDMGYIWWSPVWRLRRNTDFVGLEHLNKAIADKRTVLCFTPHSTGMDQCGTLLSSLHPAVTMMKKMKNPLLNWIITRGRLRFQGTVLLREMGLRNLVRAMKKGNHCFYIPDEDLGEDVSVFAPFFGNETATVPMLGRMAKLTNAVAIPAMVEITDAGRHRIHILPALENFPSNDDYQDALMMNQALEELIKISPKQYMWTMKMYKTRPNGEKPPYIK